MHFCVAGIGISPAQRSLLFRSFSQVQHINGEYGGTGLGLIISKRLCSAMGGDVDVTSEIARGSTFFFHVLSAQVPMAARPSKETAPMPAASSSSASSGVAPPRDGVPVAAAPPPLHLLHLSPSECAELRRICVLFVGCVTPASQRWIALLQHFGTQVVQCSDAADVVSLLDASTRATASPPLLTPSVFARFSPDSCIELPYLSTWQPLATGSTAGPTELLQPSVFAAASVLDRSISMVLLDLDSVDESPLFEAINAFTPIRVLCLFSKAHMGLPSDLMFYETPSTTPMSPGGCELAPSGDAPVHAPLAWHSAAADGPNVPALLAAEVSLRLNNLNTLEPGASASAVSSLEHESEPARTGLNAESSVPRLHLSWRRRPVVQSGSRSGLTMHVGRVQEEPRFLRGSLLKPFQYRQLIAAILMVISEPFASPPAVALLPARDGQAQVLSTGPNSAASAGVAPDALPVACTDGSVASSSSPAMIFSSTSHTLSASSRSPSSPVHTRASGVPPSSPGPRRLTRISHQFPLRILLCEDNLSQTAGNKRHGLRLAACRGYVTRVCIRALLLTRVCIWHPASGTLHLRTVCSQPKDDGDALASPGI